MCMVTTSSNTNDPVLAKVQEEQRQGHHVKGLDRIFGEPDTTGRPKSSIGGNQFGTEGILFS